MKRLFCSPALLLLACATQSTAGDTASIRQLAQTRAEIELPLDVLDSEQDGLEREALQLLSRPLTANTAVRIALLNNHNLRAELQTLGIARGQLVQATVLPNPEFDVAARFPTQGGGQATWDLGVGIDLTQMILRGARSKIAEAELAATRYRVASAVIDLALEVRHTFYDVLADRARVELQRSALVAFGAGYETARAMHEAGNITDLDLVTEQAAYERIRVAVAEAEADLLDSRERVNVLLGLHGRATDWSTEERLPDVPAAPRDRENIEARAIEANLQLAEARARLDAWSSRVGLARNSGWLPDLTVGVAAEYEDSDWEVGPQVSGTLPLFDRQQGAAQTSQAQFSELRERYVATAVAIRSAVRAAHNRLQSASERARHYREIVLPLRQRVLHETVLQYNAMQVGVFQLLQARRDELETAQMYVETLREYWAADSDLEQLLAGRLSQTSIAGSARADRSSSPSTASAVH